MRAGALKRSADFKPSGSPDAKTIAILKALLFA
jgi:hypothetical protein